jgi:hypothetical protein
MDPWEVPGLFGPAARPAAPVAAQPPRADGVGCPAELGVPVEEPAGQLRGAEPLQVHGKKRHVVQDVDVAQPVVELQTVQHPRTVGQTEDVIGDQVTVPVPD